MKTMMVICSTCTAGIMVSAEVQVLEDLRGRTECSANPDAAWICDECRIIPAKLTTARKLMSERIYA